MNVELIFRIIGMVIVSILGGYWGANLAPTFGQSPLLIGAGLAIVGGLLGLILAPYITTRPAVWLGRVLVKLPGQTLVVGLIGGIIGLIVGALLAFPLSLLPEPFGEMLPLVGALLCGYFGVVAFVTRQSDIFALFRHLPGRSSENSEEKEKAAIPKEAEGRPILLDTSVIIDGRIADIARTGFMAGTLLIPRFVLSELQYIADSSDNLRRQRGRRGMEVLSQLQKDATVPVKISDIDVEGVREVDNKLVVLARQLRCPILTNDYNLNRVAELQGVTVLNVNELANAVKSVLLPGESLIVNIIQEGREINQGVAYLDDGTMVVVEDGRDRIRSQAHVTVTKVLQTAAGRMIFARLDNNN